MLVPLKALSPAKFTIQARKADILERIADWRAKLIALFIARISCVIHSDLRIRSLASALRPCL